MDAERYQKAAAVLEDLLALPRDQRLHALERYPNLEDQLRSEIRSLLPTDEEDDFLERPAQVPSDLFDRLDPVNLELPEQVGGYPVVGLLGKGGMGIVYEVHQASVGRNAALKVLADPLADEMARARFRLEIDALARVQHPGIAQIIDAGVDESGVSPRMFFVMEKVDGVSIDRWVRDRDLTVKDIVDLFLEVCDAVEHAHQRGILHRDLKPANILVDLEGRARVLDFGIARPIQDQVTLCRVTGESRPMLGTLAYMSPEQCALEDADSDIRSDVYSLASVLFELLAGHPPIDLGNCSVVQAARRVCEQSPMPPKYKGRLLPSSLAAIILHALHKERDQRYATVSALADDLIRWRDGRPVAVQAPSLVNRIASWVVNHPVAATATGSVAIAIASLLLTGLGIWWLGWRPHRLVVDQETGWAQLLSVSGNELHSWHPVLRGEYLSGANGSPDLVVLAFSDGRRMQAFSVDEPSKPAWAVTNIPPDPPGPELGSSVIPFCNDMMVADFIPEAPGDEIMLIERLSPRSPCSIQVFDASGAVRFEVWNEGGVTGAHWYESERVLVCGGYLSGLTWSERGVSSPHNLWPIVAFGLSLEDGHVDRHEFLVGSSGFGKPVIWYKWLGPAEAWSCSRRLEPRLAKRLRGSGQMMAYLQCTRFPVPQMSDASRREYVAFYLAPDGAVEQVVTSDEYEEARGREEYPPLDTWRFLDAESLPSVFSGVK